MGDQEMGELTNVDSNQNVNKIKDSCWPLTKLMHFTGKGNGSMAMPQ